MTIVAHVGLRRAERSDADNIATVGADTADPDATNNSASRPIGVVNAAPTITGASPSRSQLSCRCPRWSRSTIAYTAADTCGAVTTTRR